MKVNYSDERHGVLVSGKYYFFVTVKKDLQPIGFIYSGDCRNYKII